MSLSVLDPEFATLAVHLPPKPSGPVSPEEFLKNSRTGFEALIQLDKEYNKPFLPAESEYTEHLLSYPATETLDLPIRVIIPIPRPNEESGFPVLFWIHGGAWVNSSHEFNHFRLRRDSVDLRAAVVQVKYRVAPEDPYPAGFDDVYAALKWTKSTVPSLFPSISLQKGFIVAGESAGGNFAAAVTHKLLNDPYFKDEKTGKSLITGTSLQIPALIHPAAYKEAGSLQHELASLEENKDAHIVDKEIVVRAFESYAGPNGDPSDPLISPLLASHEGLPPTFIQACGTDPFRDEAILHAKLLTQANVKTRIEIYPGVPHGVHYLFPNIEISKKYLKDFRDGLKWLLNEK